MIEYIKKMFQKKTVFIVIFLSAFFIVPISIVNAGTISNRHIKIHDTFFEFDNNKDYSFKQAFINAIEFGDLTYENYIILPSEDNKVILINYDLISNNDFSIRWFNSTNKEFIFNFKCLSNCNYFSISKTGRTFITMSNGATISRTYNYNFYNATSNPTIEDFFTNKSLNLPIYTKNVDLTFSGVTNLSPYYFESLEYKDNIYNWNEEIDLSANLTNTVYFFSLDGDIWKDGKYNDLVFYFKRPEDGLFDFDIELIETIEDKPSFDFVPAFNLTFLNLADTLEKIKQCEFNPDGFGGCFTGIGGSFGGGGGGGRFGDDADYCNISNYPMSISSYMDSYYGLFTIFPCELQKSKTPDYFKTTQIKITTNLEIFWTYKELEKEFITNPPNWFDWGDLPNEKDPDDIRSVSDLFKIINQYMTDNKQTINEISNVTNGIYSDLNPNINKFLTAIYSLLVLTSIALIIRK